MELVSLIQNSPSPLLTLSGKEGLGGSSPAAGVASVLECEPVMQAPYISYALSQQKPKSDFGDSNESEQLSTRRKNKNSSACVKREAVDESPSDAEKRARREKKRRYWIKTNERVQFKPEDFPLMPIRPRHNRAMSDESGDSVPHGPSNPSQHSPSSPDMERPSPREPIRLPADPEAAKKLKASLWAEYESLKSEYDSRYITFNTRWFALLLRVPGFRDIRRRVMTPQGILRTLTTPNRVNAQLPSRCLTEARSLLLRYFPPLCVEMREAFAAHLELRKELFQRQAARSEASQPTARGRGSRHGSSRKSAPTKVTSHQAQERKDTIETEGGPNGMDDGTPTSE